MKEKRSRDICVELGSNDAVEKWPPNAFHLSTFQLGISVMSETYTHCTQEYKKDV